MDQDDAKKKIKAAINSYVNRTQPLEPKPVKHNERPEKELERDILTWLRGRGFHVSVVESKATFNRKSGRYISQSVKAGFVDIVGNDSTGLGCFIELKAPGRRSTLRDNQRDFLMEKISTGCFALVVDSVDLLANQYQEFLRLRQLRQFQAAKDFLIAALPKKRMTQDDDPLFDD